MRAFVFGPAGLISVYLLTGCASGMPAQTNAPSMALPDSAQTIRVRILYTKSPATLDATGPYQFQSKKDGKSYSANGVLKVRTLSGSMAVGHQSLKGEVIAAPANSTDTLKL